jgi:hypothetical protein
MRFQLKTLSPGAVEGALAKAERYRLLNEPGEAESICLDVLEVEPGNRQALVTLLHALTDQFEESSTKVLEATRCVDRMQSEYDRAYYSGIVRERRAKAELRHGVPGNVSRAYEWIREAMTWFEQAEAVRPADNDDALLRWNACARLLDRNPRLVPAAEERREPLLSE